MSSVASMSLSHFLFTFPSVPDVASEAEGHEELAPIASRGRPMSSGAPVHTTANTDTEPIQRIIRGDSDYGWEACRGGRPSTGKERGTENRLSLAECKKYKFWVMEAMLPWDKSRGIMCNGHNHWPSNLMYRKGAHSQERRGSVYNSGSLDYRSAIDKLQPQAVQQYTLSSQDHKLYTVWNCPASARSLQTNCNVDQSEVPTDQSLESKAKRSQMQGILEAYTQCEQKPEMDSDNQGQESKELKKSKDENIQKDGQKALPSNAFNGPCKRSTSCIPSVNPPRASGSKKMRESLPGSSPFKLASNPISRKPATAPEKRNLQSTNQWIGDWDDSPALDFSPWSADDELKAERGYELCSYMRQISDPMGSKRKDVKKKCSGKKRQKPRRTSARSRRIKADAVKQSCKSKKQQPRKESLKIESRAAKQQKKTYSPGESAECNGTGECEGDEAFDDNNIMETPVASGASESEHEEEDCSNYSITDTLLTRTQDNTTSLRVNSTTEVAEGSNMQSYDHVLSTTGNKTQQQPSTQVPSADRPPLPPSNKEDEAANRVPTMTEISKDCSIPRNQLDLIETNCAAVPQKNSQVHQVINGDGDGDGGHTAEDGTVAQGEANTDYPSSVYERPQETGIIRKLKGQCGAKAKSSTMQELSQTRQALGDDIVSILPPRPSSQPSVPTFEPLKMTPRMLQPPQYTSRSHVFPSLDISPSAKTGISAPIGPNCQGMGPEVTSLSSFPGIEQPKEPLHSKNPCAVHCRKIELPIQQEDGNLVGDIGDINKENTAQGVLTFAPFSGWKTSRSNLRPEKPSTTARKFSSKAYHVPSNKGVLASETKEKSVIQTKSWDFSMANQGGKSKRCIAPALSRTCLSSHSNASKSIGDCIDLLWQHLPSDSGKGFSRTGHEVICKTISKVLEDDRFLEANEMWSKFATRRESLPTTPPGIHAAPQVMPMNGIKGMLLHLARVVHRAGLSVDWDVLHHGLANGLKEQMALDVVSNGRSEFSWPSAKERIVPGSPPSTPEKSRRAGDHRARRPRSMPEIFQVQQASRPVPEVLLAGHRSGPVPILSKDSRIRHDNSFVVLLPLPSARTDEHRWQHRTRGSSSNAPAVPANTTFRILRKIVTL